MLFPAPNNTMYAEKLGVVFKSRQFSVCIDYLCISYRIYDSMTAVSTILMMNIFISRLDGMMPAFGSALRCLNSPFPTKTNVQPNVMRIIRKPRMS